MNQTGYWSEGYRRERLICHR